MENLQIKFKFNSVIFDIFTKPKIKNEIIIIKYCDQRVPFRPNNFILIKKPEIQ